MFIASSYLAISNRPNRELRSQLLHFEEILSHEFVTPFLIVNNIADNVDPEISRFETMSLNKYSNLRIAQSKVVLQTSYSDEFGQDSDLVKKYLLNKADIIEKLIPSELFQYFGLVIRLEEIVENEDNTLEKIRSVFNKDFFTNDILDVQYNYVKKINDSKFLNISVQRFKRHSGEIIEERGKQPRATNLEEKSGLAITIDTNTKLSFINQKKQELSSLKDFISETIDFINKNDTNSLLNGNII